MNEIEDSIDDFLIVEDVDLDDETELRQLINEAERLFSTDGQRLRLSILNTEQWETVLERMSLPPGMRRGDFERYIHTVKDPSDPLHLLLSPTALTAFNRRDPLVCQEIIYAILRCLSSPLSGALARGINDIAASMLADFFKVKIFTRSHPHERDLVERLLRILEGQFGWNIKDWATSMRRTPERVLRALSTSDFALKWLEDVCENAPLAAELDKAQDRRGLMLAWLLNDSLKPEDKFFKITTASAREWLMNP